MDYTWDLELIYKGYEDPKYISDVEKVQELVYGVTVGQREDFSVFNVDIVGKDIQVKIRIIDDLFDVADIIIKVDSNELSAGSHDFFDCRVGKFKR